MDLGNFVLILFLSLALGDEEINKEGIKLLNLTENFDSCGTFPKVPFQWNRELGIHSRPWMALLKFKIDDDVQFGCGGTLLTKRFVLSAAHCIKDNDGELIQVRLGEHHIRTTVYCVNDLNNCEKGHEDIDVEKTIVHEDYNEGLNDIALVKLARDVQFIEHIRPICLPLSQDLREMVQTQLVFRVAGWGPIGFHQMSDLPLEAIVFRANCSAEFIQIDTKNLICTFGGLDGSCTGFGGDPLTYFVPYYGSKRFIQFGIVSQGQLFCSSESTLASVSYTNVAKFIPWISRNIMQ